MESAAAAAAAAAPARAMSCGGERGRKKIAKIGNGMKRPGSEFIYNEPRGDRQVVSKLKTPPRYDKLRGTSRKP